MILIPPTIVRRAVQRGRLLLSPWPLHTDGSPSGGRLRTDRSGAGLRGRLSFGGAGAASAWKLKIAISCHLGTADPLVARCCRSGVNDRPSVSP